jgi:hypothetical protein
MQLERDHRSCSTAVQVHLCDQPAGHWPVGIEQYSLSLLTFPSRAALLRCQY